MQPDATNPAVKAATLALAVPEQFEAGCQGGKKEDCFLAGAEWERKAYQAESKANAGEAPGMRKTALLAFARGCELGEARSCISLASAHKHGNDTPRNVVHAAQLYEKACALGDPTGCGSAGEMYEQGRRGRSTALGSPPSPMPRPPDLPSDPVRAALLYTRACELNDREACLVAGRLLTQSRDVAADREKALALLERACDDALPSACILAVALAPSREAEFKHRACVLEGNTECP